MKITKIGHCCLLVELNGLTILTDPGRFSTGHDAVAGVDIVLITHEHQDHLHIESLQAVLKNNPDAEVIANNAVAQILHEQNIACTVLESGSVERTGVAIEAFAAKHGVIFEDIGQVPNTGFLINGALLYPGDSLHNPERPVDVLALPVVGPWCKMPDVIAYALEVRPRVAFPVHDGLLADDAVPVFHNAPGRILPQHGIDFIPLKPGESWTTP